jgi:hypothetical protein
VDYHFSRSRRRQPHSVLKEIHFPHLDWPAVLAMTYYTGSK